MKSRVAYSLFLALMILASSCAANDAVSFHLPQTEAEKALDKILRINNSREYDLYGAVFNYPGRDKSHDKELQSLFTESFLRKSRLQEQALIKESCGGVEPADGKPCDMIRGVNPVACAQDVPETYFYRTIYQDAVKAVIFYAWPEDGGVYADGPSYTLVLKGNSWQLDKTSCEDEPH